MVISDPLEKSEYGGQGSVMIKPVKSLQSGCGIPERVGYTAHITSIIFHSFPG